MKYSGDDTGLALPQPGDSAGYWRDVYHQPLPVWQPALTRLTAAHGLDDAAWERVRLGRNIVFATPTMIVKLGPPCWPGEMAREAAALQFVAGKLPVATPSVIASGAIDGWDYIVQARLPGTPLWELWPELAPADRATLATQHGRLMAAIHAQPVADAPAALEYDWAGLRAMQLAECAAEMAGAGVDAALVAAVDAYLAATVWSADASAPVLLHGDLNHLNFLVAPHADGWQITGIVDWGDAKLGSPAHELISPGVHMYKGQADALRQWYAGYGMAPAQRSERYEHVVMARAMMYYSDMFPTLLASVEGAAECRDWPALARCFWHLR
jgi:hygromycin-B 7''-O-kinase